MYCPRCSTENNSEQQYCHRCGLQLGGVRSALEGRAEEAASRYKKGGAALSAGAIVLAVCVLVAVLNFFLSSEPRNYGMLINLLIGLLLALPMIAAGLVRVSRAERLLEGKALAVSLEGGQTGEPASLPPAGRRNDLLAEGVTTTNSVTEQTTLKLKRGAEHG